MNASRLLLLALAAATLSSVSAGAQSLAAGSVSGRVLAPGGEGVAEALVTVERAAGGGRRTTATRYDGRFEVGLLPPGAYRVRVERLGFAPREVAGVAVRPGEASALPLRLTPASSPGAAVAEAVVARGGLAGAALSPRGRRFTREEVATLPTPRRVLGDLAALASRAALPADAARWPGVRVDGVETGALPLPPGAADPLGAASLPLEVVDDAEVVSFPLDVEWRGSAAGQLRAQTRRGGDSLRVRGAGTWGAGTMAGSDAFASASAPGGDHAGFVEVGGSAGAGASFLLHGGVRRTHAPAQRAQATAAADARLAALARDTLGVPLSTGVQPLRNEVAWGMARLDWAPSERHALLARGSMAHILDPAPALAIGAPGGRPRGTEAVGALALTSRFAGGLASEVRVGVQHGTRSLEPALFAGDSGRAAPLPRVRVVASGVDVGSAGVEGSRFARTSATADALLHWAAGPHRVKAGASVEWASLRGAYLPGAAGEFTFSSADDVARGEGAFRQVVGAPTRTRFALPRAALFAQQTWTPAVGVSLTGGVRLDAAWLPAAELRPDSAWAAVSGIDGRGIASRGAQLSPRLALDWDPGAAGVWRVTAGAGWYAETVDPSLLAEAVTDGGTLRVREGTGAVRWPALPDSTSLRDAGRTLTLLAPGFRMPRTARAGAGVSRALGRTGAVHLAVDAHRTDALPRRQELNLPVGPVAADQHGRALWGTLTRRGEVLGAAPGTGRRFAGFDRVTALQADGVEERRAATVAVERAPGAGLSLLASYTYAWTRDNGVARAWEMDGAGRAPVPGAAGEVRDGRAPDDAPHRLSAALGWSAPRGRWAPELRAVYTRSSGVAFTPGFRPGVDANADGLAGNDPAFVDPELAAPLLGAWECLAEQAGSFAARNSCRGPARQLLSLHAGADVLRLGRHRGRLVVEGLNLLGGDDRLLDAALFRVDPDADLVRGTDGVVTVPLVVNPDFGTPLLRRSAGRALRVSFQMDY